MLDNFLRINTYTRYAHLPINFQLSSSGFDTVFEKSRKIHRRADDESEKMEKVLLRIFSISRYYLRLHGRVSGDRNKLVDNRLGFIGRFISEKRCWMDFAGKFRGKSDRRCVIGVVTDGCLIYKRLSRKIGGYWRTARLNTLFVLTAQTMITKLHKFLAGGGRFGGNINCRFRGRQRVASSYGSRGEILLRILIFER